ncbi:hypothetical protein B0H67DRAFT_586496, partial [Lasiosphaeris hirsuta]
MAVLVAKRRLSNPALEELDGEHNGMFILTVVFSVLGRAASIVCCIIGNGVSIAAIQSRLNIRVVHCSTRKYLVWFCFAVMTLLLQQNVSHHF